MWQPVKVRKVLKTGNSVKNYVTKLMVNVGVVIILFAWTVFPQKKKQIKFI